MSFGGGFVAEKSRGRTWLTFCGLARKDTQPLCLGAGTGAELLSPATPSLSQTGLPLVRASFQASPKVDYSHIGGYRSSPRSAKVTN